MTRFIPRFRPTVLIASALVCAVVPSVASAQSTRTTTDPTLTATDGTRTLSVSKSQELNGDGEMVVVDGSGYDVTKGIYVALCVTPRPGEAPSPCGGGADRAGTGGASVWISSNPPSYGTKLAIPFGPNGSFHVEFNVGPKINDVIDCRNVGCSIVTKSDHTIYDDRSQDLLIPVTFTGEAPPTTVPASETPTSTEVVTEITVTDNIADLARAATDDGGSNSGALVFFVAVGVVALGASILVARTRRSRQR